jgi:hypothetical protein
MTERQESQQQNTVVQQKVKLSPFLPQMPALWFTQAECSFTFKKIEVQFDKYCHIFAAAPRVPKVGSGPGGESAHRDTPPTLSDDIHERLIASHQISDFQKAERLFLMPPLGSRKPSKMMAAMLETCPHGEEKRTCSPAQGDHGSVGEGGSQRPEGAGKTGG